MIYIFGLLLIHMTSSDNIVIIYRFEWVEVTDGLVVRAGISVT